ncbi:hypothetical protein [Ralstonia phage RSP15]|uniref:hypothetical protein n=1 Tax=Ralstonia phage RSP15 TaxID=1785960 RepID=UPI00074D3935|nr:hypothetical protein BH754_gp225 [Ralstonia phage RSP15]BAU40081.1 hypothetical protein [Ralstonia phage RSP15]
MKYADPIIKFECGDSFIIDNLGCQGKITAYIFEFTKNYVGILNLYSGITLSDSNKYVNNIRDIEAYELAEIIKDAGFDPHNARLNGKPIFMPEEKWFPTGSFIEVQIEDDHRKFMISLVDAGTIRLIEVESGNRWDDGNLMKHSRISGVVSSQYEVSETGIRTMFENSVKVSMKLLDNPFSVK